MSDAGRDFIELMGLVMQEQGNPRISGQIFGYLLLEGGPRSLTQMAEALQISKGSASTNARMLEARGALRRLSPVGSRQDAYEVVDHPNEQILHNIALRFRRNADRIEAVSERFPQAQAAARGRVQGFAEFYRRSADFLDRWQEEMDGEARAPAPGAGVVR